MIRFSPVKSARSILAFKYPQSVQNKYLEGVNVSTKINETCYFIQTQVQLKDAFEN